MEGELCDIHVTSLAWRPGRIEGVLVSDCVPSTLEAVSLQTASGHHGDTQTAVMDAVVTAVTGTVGVTAGGSHSSVAFVPNGETSFSLSIGVGEAVHEVALDADLRADLEVAPPPWSSSPITRSGRRSAR